MNAAVPLLRTALNTTSLLSPTLAGRFAHALFDRPPRRARVRPQEAELMAEARTTHLEVHGRRVVVHQWGDGSRPVLLVHGYGARASWFARLVRALRQRGYTPVAFDAPGHGDSEGRSATAFDYRETIRQLHARHGEFDAVVAHSLGVAGAFFALQSGVRARKLVGIAGVSDFAGVIDDFCARLGLRPPVADAMRRHIATSVFPDEPRLFERLSTAYRAERLADLPILLLHDLDDDAVGIAHARRTAAAHPRNARLVLTENLGHRRIIGDAGTVAAVLGFLAGHPADELTADPVSEVLG